MVTMKKERHWNLGAIRESKEIATLIQLSVDAVTFTAHPD